MPNDAIGDLLRCLKQAIKHYQNHQHVLDGKSPESSTWMVHMHVWIIKSRAEPTTCPLRDPLCAVASPAGNAIVKRWLQFSNSFGQNVDHQNIYGNGVQSVRVCNAWLSQQAQR